MPTFFATGVTASLSICELRDSLSNVVDFKCGADQRADAIRLQKLLDAATPLSEHSIGPNGASHSVLQYLGPQLDMPMKMVEARMRGADLRDSIDFADDGVDGAVTASSLEPVPDAMPSAGQGSPHTSLRAIPTPTNSEFTSSHANSAPGMQQSTSQINTAETSTHAVRELPQPKYVIDPQALILNITLTAKSFMPVVSQGIKREVYDNKDLKVEIVCIILGTTPAETCTHCLHILQFLNGELVEVDFISSRRLTKGIPMVKLQYKGTRLHRQIEKPWAFVPSQLITSAVCDAPDRWRAISEALKRESEGRGRDKYGDMTPSAEYLLALSQTALPNRIEGCKGLGVFDVIIIAGKGQKYGAEVEYLTKPTRLDDAAYSTLNPIIDPDIVLGPTGVGPLTPRHNVLLSEGDSSPDIPLMQQQRTRDTMLVLTTPASRSKKTRDELKEDSGLNVNLQKTFIDTFENSKGQGSTKGRSLTQRLGDVKKMAPNNQLTEMQKLREEFSVPEATEEPTKKRLRVESAAPEYAVGIPDLQNAMADFDARPSYDLFKTSTPTHLINQTLSEARNSTDLAQSRMELAIDLGADPTGYLTDQIASIDHEASAKSFSTPQKRTKASALANSPARVPVKTQKPQGRSAQQQHIHSAAGALDDTPIPFTLGRAPAEQPTMNVYAAMKASKLARNLSKTLSNGAPSRGAGRSAKAWLPGERTAAEALAEFETPVLSVGSCLTYAPDLGVIGGGGAALGGKVQRQIGKSRKGEFREQEVVVGMRFCVM